MALTKTILDGHEVEYDNTEFEILTNYYKGKYLHYIGNGKNITNPKGNTSCYAMFHKFKGTSLDLSNFDTKNITRMGFMFSNCSNLEQLNLSNFDTSNVKYTNGMFSNCKNIKHLNLSNFNTNKVTNMDFMFYECINLKTLDISSFYIDDTKILDSMFWYCRSLETLKVSSDSLQFFLDNKKSLFRNCGNVNIIPINKLDKAIEDLLY